MRPGAVQLKQEDRLRLRKLLLRASSILLDIRCRGLRDEDFVQSDGLGLLRRLEKVHRELRDAVGQPWSDAERQQRKRARDRKVEGVTP